jgi:hypothetical protein
MLLLLLLIWATAGRGNGKYLDGLERGVRMRDRLVGRVDDRMLRCAHDVRWNLRVYVFSGSKHAEDGEEWGEGEFRTKPVGRWLEMWEVFV